MGTLLLLNSLLSIVVKSNYFLHSCRRDASIKVFLVKMIVKILIDPAIGKIDDLENYHHQPVEFTYSNQAS